MVRLEAEATAVAQLAEMVTASATRTGFDVRVLLCALELSKMTADLV